MGKFVNGSPQFHIFVKWAIKKGINLDAVEDFGEWWECWQDGWKDGWLSAQQSHAADRKGSS